MAIDISHDPRSGSWSFSYKRHVFVALGLLLIANGLATLSGPWWQAIAVALLGKIGVSVEDRYLWVLAAAQIVPGLLILAYKHFIIDRDAARVVADRRTAAAAELDFNRLRNYLTYLVDDHSYQSSLNSVFHHALTFFSLPEQNFQSPPLAAAFKSFEAAGAELQNFVATNFYVFPNIRPLDGDYRYCLAPHMNIDREMLIYDADKVAEYNRLKVRLHELVFETQAQLNGWIQCMRRAGVI